MAVNGNLFVPLGGFGRNINHDPRSKAFKAARRETAPGAAGVVPRTIEHKPRIAPLDQGNLGRCVPTAGTAMLSTPEFYATLDPAIKRVLNNPDTAEQWSIAMYREVTRIDPFPGAYEPEDTGSDGLSLWKLYRSLGFVNGSTHVMSLEDAHVALQGSGDTPGVAYPIGISWLSEMANPGSDGVVKVAGYSQGGHEVLLYGYDAARDLWWCRNSWGAGWGRTGDFAFSSEDYMKLMSMQADGVVMHPVTAPLPEPTPQLVDGNGLETFPYTEMDHWARRVSRKVIRTQYETAAARAYAAWRG